MGCSELPDNLSNVLNRLCNGLDISKRLTSAAVNVAILLSPFIILYYQSK